LELKSKKKQFAMGPFMTTIYQIPPYFVSEHNVKNNNIQSSDDCTLHIWCQMWLAIISFGRIGEKSPIANSWATFHYYYKIANKRQTLSLLNPSHKPMNIV